MCGIFGVIGKEHAAELLLQGLIHLQHRGQDAAGIFTYDQVNDCCVLQKNRGLVNQVFSSKPFPEGQWGIGHLRYATAGMGGIQDVQPIVITKNDQTIALVHNGNIVNYLSIKQKLMQDGVSFQTTSDTEVILQILAPYLQEKMTFDRLCSAVSEVYAKVEGAYSILGIIAGEGLFAFRDPLGFRPLMMGTKEGGKVHLFSSETGPLFHFDAEEVCDIEPGQLLFIDQNNRVHRRHLNQRAHTHCGFEFNYFAKSNAVIENEEVYQARFRLGTSLAKQVQKSGFVIDAVVPVPDTAKPSALALARALNIPIEEGFVKQDNVGRTFIMPTQDTRKKAVSSKLSTVNSVFKDKRILLVDDSIVRGTVSKQVVNLARKAGAKEIYFASTYPPVLYPCYYGIDFPIQEELIAWGKSNEEICEAIGVDGLVYNSVQDFKESIGFNDLCTACLTGDYPTCTKEIHKLKEQRLINLKHVEKSRIH